MNTSDVPTEEQGGEQPIRYVLFVCNHSAGRSQMALRRETCDLITTGAAT